MITVENNITLNLNINLNTTALGSKYFYITHACKGSSLQFLYRLLKLTVATKYDNYCNPPILLMPGSEYQSIWP